MAKKNGSALQRMLGNKNTVTILGLAGCVVTLIFGYNYRVSKAISPTTVPYAKDNIAAKTLITEDMIDNVKISSDYVNVATNLIKTGQSVIGKYTNYKSAVPKGSLFYNDMILTAEDMPDAAFANIEEGNTIYSLTVNKESTISNSIRAGQYIDLYMRKNSGDDEKGDNGKAIYGCFVKKIKVLAVKDSAGRNITENGLIRGGTPAELLFSVSEDNYLLLYDAEQLGFELEPVLFNDEYTAQGGETVTSAGYLRELIESKLDLSFAPEL